MNDVELLNSLFLSRDYERLLAELTKIRLTFLDEKYPNIIHDIIWQIDDAERLYRESNYQSLNLVIKNILGIESGKYRLGNKRTVISLKEASVMRMNLKYFA